MKLAPATITVLHAIIARALKIAVRDKLIVANPATAVEDRPRTSKDHSAGARLHCWTAAEARAVLTAAQAAGAQVSAFLAVLLDTGCRKSEALGLTWPDVDLKAGTLPSPGNWKRAASTCPTWGPTKTCAVRVVTPRGRHDRPAQHAQASAGALKMKNRTTYQDAGLVFAKEPGDLQTPTGALGQPCRALARRCFRQVLAAAGVRPSRSTAPGTPSRRCCSKRACRSRWSRSGSSMRT